MRVLEKIGQRDVLASGTVVLGGGEAEVTVQIEDLRYIFNFMPFDAPPTATAANDDPKSLRFSVMGSMDTPSSWFYPEVGRINGRALSLGFSVLVFRANPDKAPDFEFTYTLSGAPRVIPALAAP